MSISNSDVAAMPTYTNAELLIVLRAAVVTVSVGNQAVVANGRTYTRANLAELWAVIKELEDLTGANEATAGPNVSRANFGNFRS